MRLLMQPRPQGLLLDDFQNGNRRGEGPGDEVACLCLCQSTCELACVAGARKGKGEGKIGARDFFHFLMLM